MEALAKQLQSDQQELQSSMVEHQKLEIQFQESRIVKEEFDSLADDAKIFKLMGPVLVPQEKPEADSNVAKRLEFITSQKSQAESRIQTLRDRMQKAQLQLRELQIKAAVDAQGANAAKAEA